MKDVVPIYFTKYIPNDTVSVRSGMSKSFKKKLAKAFKDIAKTKKGKKILENIYQHYGYVDSKDSNFNIVREYEAEAKKLKNKFNIFKGHPTLTCRMAFFSFKIRIDF